MQKNSSKNTSSNKNVVTKFLALYDELFAHNGYGEVRIEMRILHHDQKEIIIHCGKQYRFVVDYQPKKNEEVMPMEQRDLSGGAGRELRPEKSLLAMR